MAQNKKSFLLYADIIHTVKKMPKDKQADLFMVILEYVNDLNPAIEDILIEIAFEPIKQSLKRDLIKYESIVERNRSNGLKGGRPTVEPKKPSGLIDNPSEPKKADSDSDNDSDSVTFKKSKQNIELRKLNFEKSLIPFVSEFSKETVRDFSDYWTEKNPSETKMRFELEKTFEAKRRLTTWKARENKNDKNFSSNKPQPNYRKL